MAGMRFVKEVNSRQTANTVMISDTKFGEITDKLIKLVETSGVEIEPGVSGIKMTEAKKFLRKSVHNGQSVDDAIRYLQDCGEIKVKRASSGNTMYLIINDQQPSQSQPLEQPKVTS
jgi:20S proteasome alpha/beta subunit